MSIELLKKTGVIQNSPMVEDANLANVATLFSILWNFKKKGTESVIDYGTYSKVILNL